MGRPARGHHANRGYGRKEPLQRAALRNRWDDAEQGCPDCLCCSRAGCWGRECAGGGCPCTE